MSDHDGYSFKRYWSTRKDSPLLASIVRATSITPATSVPSESAFSIANYLQSKERSSLSAANLRMTMLLRDKNTVDKLLDHEIITREA